jgi:UDP-2,4-diacetamido-2,4,6-trideoxy-beta-L-altropyranose hydrolase
MQCQLITARRAEPDDCETLWRWANDPEVREASFQSATIPWKEHVEWFKRKLHDPGCLFFVGTDEGGLPVGQVRFDCVREGEFDISISIDPGKRGAGLGASVLTRAMEAMLLQTRRAKMHAYVKPHNQSSIRLFTDAGFQRLEGTQPERHSAIHFVYDAAKPKRQT